MKGADAFAAGNASDATKLRMLEKIDYDKERLKKIFDSRQEVSLGQAIESASADQKQNAENTQKCLIGLLAYSELNKYYAIGAEKQLVMLNPDPTAKKATEVIQADGRITTVSTNGACESKPASRNMKSIVTDMAADTFDLALKSQETKVPSTAPAVLATCLSSDVLDIR